MSIFKRMKWNSIFECFEGLHVWYQMKAYMCANTKAKQTRKQSIWTYKNHIFLKTRCTFSVRTALIQLVFIIRQVEDYQNILKLSCRPLTFASFKTFWKTKRGLELVSLPHFLHDFWWKIFLLLYSNTWPNCLVAFASWDIVQYVYCSYLLTRLWRRNFWN